MSITVKVEEVLAAAAPLKALRKTDLPAQAAFVLSRIAKAADIEIANYQENHNALLARYGTKTLDDAWEIKPSDANWKDYYEAVLAILKVEITVSCEPLKIGLLGDTKLDWGTLNDLGPFVVGD